MGKVLFHIVQHVAVITQQIIDAVKDLVNNDPHISIATILGIVYHINIVINTQRDQPKMHIRKNNAVNLSKKWQTTDARYRS